MRALTVRQPYAGLIVAGVKTIEVRTWPTLHRGPLLIHAGRLLAEIDRGLPPEVLRQVRRDHPDLLDRWGAIIGVVDLIGCRRIQPADGLAALCEATSAEFAWVLDRARVLARPVPTSGQYGLWLPTIDVRRALHDQGADPQLPLRC